VPRESELFEDADQFLEHFHSLLDGLDLLNSRVWNEVRLGGEKNVKAGLPLIATLPPLRNDNPPGSSQAN
jgi:hypothetical protein